MSVQQKFKADLLNKLVLETVQSRLSVKESLDYIIKYFHRIGRTDYTMSQSNYEKLRRIAKDRIKADFTGSDEKLSNVSNDTKTLDRLIDIHFLRIQGQLVITNPDNNLSNLSEFSVLPTTIWSIVNDTTDILIKLITTKNKIR